MNAKLVLSVVLLALLAGCFGKGATVGGANNVQWTLPDTLPKGANLTAVEVWRSDDGLVSKVGIVQGTYVQLKHGNFTDTNVGLTSASKYRVTMVFAPEQRGADPVTGYSSLVDNSPSQTPVWVYVLAGVGLALLVAGIVIFVVLRKKQAETSTGGVAYAWESADPSALGVDEATGLPLHEVKCPNCANPFQAVGKLPLAITCPNCGTTGSLD